MTFSDARRLIETDVGCTDDEKNSYRRSGLKPLYLTDRRVLPAYFCMIIFKPETTSVRALIIITAVVIVPAFEEMLFRGLFQTWLRSLVARPWLAILICSGMFAVIHADAGHWPALLALSMSMGYAYEKSGSLFRPIFIHSLFNATSIIAVLNQ